MKYCLSPLVYPSSRHNTVTVEIAAHWLSSTVEIAEDLAAAARQWGRWDYHHYVTHSGYGPHTCSMGSTLYCTIMHTVHCTVYPVQFTQYSVYCTVYCIPCAVYTVQCIQYTVYSAVYNAQYTVYTAQCTVAGRCLLVSQPHQYPECLYNGRCDTRDQGLLEEDRRGKIGNMNMMADTELVSLSFWYCKSKWILRGSC